MLLSPDQFERGECLYRECATVQAVLLLHLGGWTLKGCMKHARGFVAHSKLSLEHADNQPIKFMPCMLSAIITDQCIFSYCTSGKLFKCFPTQS